MIHSLQARLFIGLTTMVAVMCAAVSYFAYTYAFNEAIEMQDATLTQVAALAVGGRFEQHMLPSGNVDADNRLVIEEIGGPNAKAPKDEGLIALDDGLRDVTRGSERWRVLIRTRPDGSRLMTGQPTSVREEIASDLAWRTALPMATLIPPMLLLTAWLVRRSMRPVRRLADALDGRSADDLEELALSGVPLELQPFLASINRLLRRIHLLLEHQRRFIADAAHELRTPITALTLQADNLDQIAWPEHCVQRLDALKEGTRRTKRLLEQLLMLERVGLHAERPTIASLEKCAHEVVADLLPRAAERGIDLGFNEIEPCVVPAQPLEIELMIRNLLENALRHTPTGGRIDISVRRSDQGAVFLVEDTGPGIPEGEMSRVFEPFFRGAEHVSEGSGLGLSIVKRIVDKLNGAVTVQNIGNGPTPGLRATVRLPSSPSKPALPT